MGAAGGEQGLGLGLGLQGWILSTSSGLSSGSSVMPYSRAGKHVRSTLTPGVSLWSVQMFLRWQLRKAAL